MVASALIVLACLASLSAAAPAEEQGVEIVRSIEIPSEDSYSHAASNPQITPLASSDPGAPDHALAPPPADQVAPVARHLVLMPQEEEQQELVRDKRQFGGYGGYGGRRGYGRRHRYGGYGGYPGGYGGGYGGYPGGYGGGYGGYPGGYGGGYGGYPGGGFGGSNSQSSANAQSFSVGGGFGPFQGSFSSSQASSSAGGGGFGFGR